MILPNTAVWKKIATDMEELCNLLHVTECSDSENIVKECVEKSGSIGKTGKTFTIISCLCNLIIRDIKMVV